MILVGICLEESVRFGWDRGRASSQPQTVVFDRGRTWSRRRRRRRRGLLLLFQHRQRQQQQQQQPG